MIINDNITMTRESHIGIANRSLDTLPLQLSPKVCGGYCTPSTKASRRIPFKLVTVFNPLPTLRSNGFHKGFGILIHFELLLEPFRGRVSDKDIDRKELDTPRSSDF